MARDKYPCEEQPMYATWLAITQRCNNPSSTNYPRYGAKGVRMHEDFNNFKVFSDYVSQLPNYGTEGYTLDRIETTGNYEKGNLRWADRSTQTANQVDSGKGNNTYTGVNWSKTHNRWVARVNFQGKSVFTKVCQTEQEAYEVRKDYIESNGLPHHIKPWVG